MCWKTWAVNLTLPKCIAHVKATVDLAIFSQNIIYHLCILCLNKLWSGLVCPADWIRKLLDGFGWNLVVEVVLFCTTSKMNFEYPMSSNKMTDEESHERHWDAVICWSKWELSNKVSLIPLNAHCKEWGYYGYSDKEYIFQAYFISTTISINLINVKPDRTPLFVWAVAITALIFHYQFWMKQIPRFIGTYFLKVMICGGTIFTGAVTTFLPKCALLLVKDGHFEICSSLNWFRLPFGA